MNGGVAQVSAQFKSSVYQGVAKALSQASTTYDTAAWAGALLVAAEILQNEEVGDLPIASVFRILESRKLIQEDPAAWILTIRLVLNMTKHPNGRLAERVQRCLREAKDPAVAAYALAQDLFAIVRSYQPDAMSSPQLVLASY